MLTTWLLVVMAVVVAMAWWYSRMRHSFWDSKGVPTPPSLPFIGHLHKILSPFTSRWDALDEIYYKFCRPKFFGMYECFRPSLIVCDPDLLKHILVKDFDHFVNRRNFGDQPGSLQNEMLANKHGEEWKVLRSIMSPTFSSGKMKKMFPLVCENADTLISSCLRDGSRNLSLNMKDKFGRFTMDTIASCAFGIECNSFSKENALFIQNAESFFGTSPLKVMKMSLMIMFPKVFTALGLKVDSTETMFFRSVVDETIKKRQTGQHRGDFLDLMMEAQKGNNDTSTSVKHVLQDRVVVAQSIMFLVAGYDTTASTIAFSSWLLAKNPEKQKCLRQELRELVQKDGELTYQGVMEAKFLDGCIQETLRLYPPGTVGERICNKTYTLPGTDLTLREGDLVQFPIWSLHHDPNYWPDPLQFRPERFLPENKVHIKSFTHMPFGLGPRNCLAMRFALMEIKVALAKLVLAADVQLAPGYEEIVLDLSPFILRPKKGLYMIITPHA